jgi:predicted transcriptional regulator
LIVFSSSSIIPILRELNSRKTAVTGREIARLSGMTHRSALKALENLEAINLVKKQVAGRTYYFTINREHYLYKKIVSIIFKSEKDFYQE